MPIEEHQIHDVNNKQAFTSKLICIVLTMLQQHLGLPIKLTLKVKPITQMHQNYKSIYMHMDALIQYLSIIIWPMRVTTLIWPKYKMCPFDGAYRYSVVWQSYEFM